MRREKDQVRHEIEEGMDMFFSNVAPKRRVIQRRKEWECPRCEALIAAHYKECPTCGSPYSLH